MRHLSLHPLILKNIFSSMSNGVIVVDQNQKVALMNKAAEQLLQLTEAQCIGRDIQELVPNTEVPRVLRSGKGSIGTKLMIGDTHCMVNRTPFYQDGELAGVVSEIQDISQMEHYQSLLKQLENIIEFSSDGIYVVDHEGHTLFVNSAYEEITGFKREELIGNHMGDLMARGYFDQSVSLLVLQSKKQISILQSIGGKKDVTVTGNPVFDEAGRIQMVVTSVRDITRLQEVTEELKKAKSFSALNQNRFTFSTDNPDETVIFQSPQMKQIVHRVQQVAPFPTGILLSGPSGAGKEVIANLIHQLSNRRDRPFIKINCGAIPEQLLESELFGYERGAFTGARQEGKIGLLELADKGTVLLDEVAELPLSLQVKLLRVLQEKQIQRIGSRDIKKLDIRIISATNKNLKELSERGLFREDLYYRLQVVEIRIPPLQERPEDIAVLLEHFFSYFCRLYSIEKQLSPETKRILQGYHWPGNVRELKNLIEGMIVSIPSLVIEAVDLPPHISITGQNQIPVTLRERVEQFERKLVKDALQLHPSIRKTAEALGVDHSTLVKKLKKWGLRD
ncbi:sigma 54-interacting transcriptional regulator [Ectobacillus ponti]|uniref:HTH-type transcriptional regulatory protein TyrR n=1 Tax=Ectobacillus ponti TaxID=2961894 RepID=A0AA41XAP9_9BACI|nr:sigma 54-interacting transcriptional regulator [Ectobacillus ponti]MCP8969859.1 sigma 54-interacting transcriptional regulator [Ectobacillus ponti]